MGEIFVLFSIFLPTLLLLLLLPLIFFKKENNKGKKLPPGSMGWPLIGETFHLYSRDPTIFFLDKQKRYGEIFKTHIHGCPCVMLATPEAARFVLVTQAHLFKPTYPHGKERLIGPSALFFHQSDAHLRLRKLVQSSLSPDPVRALVPYIDALASSALAFWLHGHTVNTFEEMKKFSFEVGILAIFGHLEDDNYRDELMKNYSMVNRGYNSFLTNIPGTIYKKALKARKRLGEIISCIISEKRQNTTKKLAEKNLLGCLLKWRDEKGETLSDEQIADNLIGVLFAAQDTTASVLTWVLKYLHDNRKVLQAVKAEQKAIEEAINGGSRPMSWSHTRNMPFTNKVVLESLRMASIITFTFREAVADVEYNGYLIPKGWKVMPLFSNIHHNSEYFVDPHKFDPSRFEVAPRPNTFMPFGSGVHACPGNELAKLEILIMIHHLVTKFRWEFAGRGDGIHHGPFPVPLDGLPIRVWRLSN
ncbi:abscisic acid 8'-hydroxylase 4-like [Momordica charantia]|uniref:(+)-abscisic acid 8'-hydroxylase n=1 Tax=Momordica charantia TaxID=3673 RepID=A0A6J1CQS3_MOMCH|nr:abscisic acid 8'-hydroxylase 4-like [Momordica charantia]